MNNILMRGMCKRNPSNVVQSHFARVLPNHGASFCAGNDVKFSLFDPFDCLTRNDTFQNGFNFYSHTLDKSFITKLSPFDGINFTRANRLAALMSAQRVGRLGRSSNINCNSGNNSYYQANLPNRLKYNNHTQWKALSRDKSNQSKEAINHSSSSSTSSSVLSSKKSGVCLPLQTAPNLSSSTSTNYTNNHKNVHKSKSSPVKYANIENGNCKNGANLLDIDFDEYDNPDDSLDIFLQTIEDAIEDGDDMMTNSVHHQHNQHHLEDVTSDANQLISNGSSQDGNESHFNESEISSSCGGKESEKRKNFSLKLSLKKWIPNSIFKSKSGHKPLAGDWNEFECKSNSSKSSISGKINSKSDSSQSSCSEQGKQAMKTNCPHSNDDNSTNDKITDNRSNCRSNSIADSHSHQLMQVSSTLHSSTLSSSSLTASSSSSTVAKGNNIFYDHCLKVKLVSNLASSEIVPL